MKILACALVLVPTNLVATALLHLSSPKPAAKETFCDCESDAASPRASEAFSASALQIPDVKEPAIWRDPKRSLIDREGDLVGRMSLAEKVSQLKNDAPRIDRLGLPAFNYWNEALHGIANNGAATVFPEPIGGAASWNPALFHQEGTVIGIEGRAKFNEYANAHNGDSKWWYGLTYWTPNINIFRDPRWGSGQETYGEDPFLTGEIGAEFVKGIQGDNPKTMLAMACAKHYASTVDRNRSGTDSTPRLLSRTSTTPTFRSSSAWFAMDTSPE